MVMNTEGNLPMASDDISGRLRRMIQEVQHELSTTKKSSLTPEWLIENDKIFSSEIDKYEDKATQCYSVEIGGDRHIMHDSSGELRGENVVLHSCLVCLPLGEHIPLLQEKMYSGKVLETLTIRRITNIEDTTKDIEVMTFEECRVTACEQIKSLFAFSFSYKVITTTYIVYNPSDGSKVGQNGTTYDSGTLTTKSVS